MVRLKLGTSIPKKLARILTTGMILFPQAPWKLEARTNFLLLSSHPSLEMFDLILFYRGERTLR